MTGTQVSEWHALWADGPASHEWSHSGIAVLNDGRVVFAAPGEGSLVFLDERTGQWSRLATPTSVNHGIQATERSGRDGLWLADPGTPDRPGQLVWLDLLAGTFDAVPAPSPAWRPTSSAVVTARGPHEGEVWIADGYGESFVYLLRADGRIDVFDGTATGQRFDCPHGVVIDDRGPEPLVVVADRRNRRLVFLDLDGRPVRTVADELLTSPSSIARRGPDLLVTDLFGALLAVDERDRVRALLGDGRGERAPGWPNALRDGDRVPPPLVEGVLNSPHGIAVAPSGEVYLTEWMLGGRQTRLRLGQAEG